MHSISPLASGIVGATQGSAKILKRSSLVATTWYEDFEGASARTGDVALDANGGAEAYVNELVTVKVYDSNGSLVRVFTAGADSPNVEVKSQSFTGTNYTVPTTAAGEPTTLQSVLDLWKDSAGAIDFLVKNGSSTITLEALAASLVSDTFNVKAAPYNATGDGVTDDRDAVQSALNAASAVGGTVLFPEGDYYCKSALAVPVGIQLVGIQPSVSVIVFDSASVAEGNNPMLTTPAEAGRTVMVNIGVRGDATPSSLTNGDGYIWHFGGNGFVTDLALSNCSFGSSSFGSRGLIEFSGQGTLYMNVVTSYVDRKALSGVVINMFNEGSALRWDDGAVTYLNTSSLGNVVDALTAAVDVQVTRLTIDTGTATGGVGVIRATDGGVRSGRIMLADFVQKGTLTAELIGVNYGLGSGDGPVIGVHGFTVDEGATCRPAEINGPTKHYYESGVRDNMLRESTTATTYTVLAGYACVLLEKTNVSGITINFPNELTGAVDGQEMVVGVEAAGGGSVVVTWGTNTRPCSATMTSGTGDWRLARFIYDGVEWIEIGTNKDTA